MNFDKNIGQRMVSLINTDVGLQQESFFKVLLQKIRYLAVVDAVTVALAVNFVMAATVAIAVDVAVAVAVTVVVAVAVSVALAIL